MTVFAKSFGPPPPPAGGPMGGPPPAGGGFPPPPQQFPAPTGGFPPPTGAPHAPLPAGNAGRRKKFGAALEGMIQPPARPPQPPQQMRQRQMMPPQLPPQMGGNAPSMMPRNQMVAPGTPMMRTPTARPMRNGGIVQYFEDGGLSQTEQDLVSKYGWTDAGNGMVRTPGGKLYDYEAGDTFSDRLVSELPVEQQFDVSDGLSEGAYTAYNPTGQLTGKSVVQLMETPSGSYKLVDTEGDLLNFSDIYTGDYSPEFAEQYGNYLGESPKYGGSGLAYSNLDSALSNISNQGFSYGGIYTPVEEVAPVEEVVVDDTTSYTPTPTPTPTPSTIVPYSGSYTPEPVDSSQVGTINYDDFTGDIGKTYTGYPEGSQTPDNAALFGPNVGIPQRVSQYYTDAVTGGLTTTNGPVMTATSPIGAINLPARPVSIDVFDWLRSPTYGSIDPIKDIEEGEEKSLGFDDNILKLQEGGAVNSFDDGTYTIRDLNSGETENYESGQSYGEEDLPADVAYSKQVQENREKLGLPPNETSAWSMWQQGTHWSQKKPSDTSVSSIPDTGTFQSGTSETIISSPASSSVSASPSDSVAQASTVQEPINYDNFTGDIGETYGGYPEGSRTPDTAALFGPNVSIPKYESKYVQDPVTRTITTTAGPTMTAVSPIGAINLPASPIDLDIFDFLRDPIYGSLDPIGLRNGGSVPRNTMIADQPHMLAYINQDEEALLRSFGGSGVSGPGGIPSYPPDSSVNLDYGYTSDGFSAADATADDDKPSYYEPPGFDFDGDGVSGEGSDVLDNNDSNPFVDLPDFSDDNVTPVYDPSDEDYGGGSDETDFNQPVVVDKTVVTPTPKPKPRPTYNDLHGNTFYSQAEADASNRAYAREAYMRKLLSDTQDVAGGTDYVGVPYDNFEYMDQYGNIRYANRGDVIPNQNLGKPSVGTSDREINPFSYTRIGGIDGGDTTGGGVGVTTEPFLDPNLSQVKYPSILNQDVKAGFLGGIPSLEGKPVISLDKPVKDGLTTPDYATMPMGEMGRGTAMPLTGSADMPPELLPMNTPREARDILFDRSEGEGAIMPGYQAEKDLIAMAEYPNHSYMKNILGEIDYESLMAPDLPLTDDDMGLPSGPYTPSAFPSGRSEVDIFQPPQEADEEETKEALMNAVKKRVSEVEGTTTDEYGEGGYSRLLGGTEQRFTDKPLTEMTVAEVLELQKQRGPGSYAEYSKGVNEKIGSLREDGSPNISTPAGKYQIVGDTLEKLIKDGVVDPDAKFDAATQEKLGSYLIENRGLFDTDTSREDFVTSLGQEFAGIKDKGYDGTISSQLKQGLGTDTETGTQSTTPQKLSEEEAAKLKSIYGLEARGLDPDDDPRRANLAVNAAEAKYLQQLLKGVDDPNMLEKILGKIGSNLTLGMVDFNKLSRDQAQKVLDAYRETGSFVYDTEGNAIDLKTVEDLEKLEALSTGRGQEPAVIGVRDEDGNVVSYGSDIQNTMEGPVEVDIFEEISQSDDDDTTTTEDKNYTVGPDGNIICNDEGYVYSEAAGMCVPVEETDSTSTITPRDVTTRSLEDIIGGIATPGPKIAPISANIRPMQGGGMAGLNSAADNFLKALVG